MFPYPPKGLENPAVPNPFANRPAMPTPPSDLQSPSTNSDYCKPCLLAGRINRYDARHDYSGLIHRVVHGHWRKVAEAYTQGEQLYERVKRRIAADRGDYQGLWRNRVDGVLRWLHR